MALSKVNWGQFGGWERTNMMGIIPRVKMVACEKRGGLWSRS